jgi:hypothetical protein
MKTLYLDAFSGVSGDMFLGLLCDLGVPEQEITAELAKLSLPGWSLTTQRERRRGIAGCRALVTTAEEHHHRSWADIDRLLAAAPLTPAVAELARRIFRRLGVAEGLVHGVPLEKVHFHEVGALDSIVDIVGAAAGLLLLAPQRIVCSPLPLAHGMVETAHGRYPLPAPATLEVLRGCPVAAGGSQLELVTPTGAAIVTEIASFGPLPPLTVERIGYGVGSRDLPDRPNLLRGILGAATDANGLERDSVTVLETHIDDSTPEVLGHLVERLLASGALDVAYGPLQMKKNRPGVRLTVVAEPVAAETLARLILRESSAIGVRFSTCPRLKLRREGATVATALGEAQVKLLFDGEELLRVTPEYESCRALALAAGWPLAEVMRIVEAAGHTLRAAGGKAP